MSRIEQLRAFVEFEKAATPEKTHIAEWALNEIERLNDVIRQMDENNGEEKNKMRKIMYEINWHSVDNIFTHCSVTPITVIREGILPGCYRVSVTAIDSSGREFQSSADDYYETEKAAWVAISIELAKDIAAREREVAHLQTQLSARREYLSELTP